MVRYIRKRSLIKLLANQADNMAENGNFVSPLMNSKTM